MSALDGLMGEARLDAVPATKDPSIAYLSGLLSHPPHELRLL